MKWEYLLCEEKLPRKNKKNSSNNDNRNLFVKDYHTIISSSSFRRLQDKAQVFPLEKYDFVRTRLTHSIEVASIAKSLGNNLIDFIMKKENCNNIKYIPTILECAGLLHDMGNPPFGHFGESSIRDWFKENLSRIYYDLKTQKFSFIKADDYSKSLIEILNTEQQNDFYNFEGNAQSLRIVTKLAYMVDDKGMNLTFPLLNTIIKYPVTSNNINDENIISHKMGYFFSEKKIFSEIVNSTKTCIGSPKRHPLTFLLEAADDITYLTGDLEDAFNKKKLRVYDILELFEKEDYKYDSFCQLTSKKIYQYKDEAKKQNYKNIDMYVIQRLKSFIQSNLINYAENSFIENYTQIMNGTFNDELLNASPSKIISKFLRECAKNFIYNSKEILLNEIKGHKVINGILDELIISVLNIYNYKETTTFGEKLYQLISDNYRLVFENNSENIFNGHIEDELERMVYYKLLLVTDFVCGMTDSYAYEFYQSLQSIE